MKIIKKIKVDLGDRSYPIIIGNGIYGNKNLYRNSNPKNSILVSTKKIKNLKNSSIPNRFYNSEILIGDGENFKNLNSCESIYKNLLKCGVNCEVKGDDLYIFPKKEYIHYQKQNYSL